MFPYKETVNTTVTIFVRDNVYQTFKLVKIQYSLSEKYLHISIAPTFNDKCMICSIDFPINKCLSMKI